MSATSAFLSVSVQAAVISKIQWTALDVHGGACEYSLVPRERKQQLTWLGAVTDEGFWNRDFSSRVELLLGVLWDVTFYSCRRQQATGYIVIKISFSLQKYIVDS